MTAALRIACVGDSITQGQVSSNYVKLLERDWKPQGFEIVNAGINGDLAYNVAQRLDAVIEQKPDLVTLLVGTNDVNSQFDDAWRARYRKDQKLPVDPTHDWYRENVSQILTRLGTETNARVAVLTIPPLGEYLGSRMNGLVNEYNSTLIELAARHDAVLLPLHDRLVELLPSTHTPPPFEGNIRKIMGAGAQHFLLRRSWNTVSQRNGLRLLTDHIHLNDSAAQTVATLVGGFIKDNRT